MGRGRAQRADGCRAARGQPLPAGPGDKVVVFGAGPIGLGASIGLPTARRRPRGRRRHHPVRLEKALQVGADAVVNSAEEDVAARLIELHGEAHGPFVRGTRPGTDIYLDAAGAPAVSETVRPIAKQGARLSIVAVHKKPVELDLGGHAHHRADDRAREGYPTEIFEVTDDSWSTGSGTR